MSKQTKWKTNKWERKNAREARENMETKKKRAKWGFGVLGKVL